MLKDTTTSYRFCLTVQRANTSGLPLRPNFFAAWRRMVTCHNDQLQLLMMTFLIFRSTIQLYAGRLRYRTFLAMFMR